MYPHANDFPTLTRSQALLERIQAERAAAKPAKKTQRKKACLKAIAG